MKRALPLILLHLFFFYPVLAGAQSTVKIFGTVLDRASRTPLARANVVVEGTGFGASTDSQGRYEIENLLAGSYRIRANHIGYAPGRIVEVRVVHDTPVHVDFALDPEAIVMPPVQVSAARGENEPQPGIWVLDAEAIARRSARDAGELLKTAPGVEIQENGGVKRISIRGSASNQVLVLLDGVPLNDELGGDVDLSLIPVHTIEQIRVIRGSGSVRHGSGALGGVIEIRTRDSFQGRYQLDGSYGSFSSMNLEPSLSGSYRGISYALSYRHAESRGDFPYSYRDASGTAVDENRINADLLQRTLYLRVAYSLGGHRFSLHGQRLFSDRGLPGKIHAWTAYARGRMENDLFGASYRFSGKRLSGEFNAGYSNALCAHSNLYPKDAELRFKKYYPWDYQYTVRNLVLSTDWEWKTSAVLNLRSGYRGRRLRFRDEDFLPFMKPPIDEARDLSHGVYLETVYNLGLPLVSGRIELAPAVRYNRLHKSRAEDQRIESQWSPGVRALLTLGRRRSAYLKTHWTKAYRAPTFADLFYQDARVQGLPDLRPEKSRETELSLGGRLDLLLRINAEFTAFRQTIDDLIVWKLGSFEVFRPVNTDAEISGREIRLDLALPGDRMAVELSHTHLSPLNRSENVTTRDKILPYRPQNSFKARLELSMDRGFAALSFRRIGERFVNDANTVRLPPHQILDLDLSWRIGIRRLQTLFKFSILNLTDQDYEIIRDMPLAPREYRLGLSLTLF